MNHLSNTLTTMVKLTLTLSLVLTAAACASEAPSTHELGTLEMALDEVPVPATTSASLCLPISIGGPGNCKPYKFWVKRAEETCADIGMQVAQIEPHKRCTKTRFTGADVMCCNAEAQECVIDMVGSKTSCKSDSTWMAIAAKSCAQQGKSLTHMTTGVECGGGKHRYARFECCGVTMTCDEGDHWDNELGACCPDATWIADCWCPDGWEYSSAEVFDDNGCLLGVGCECSPPNCDDDSPVMCDMMPPECPDGLVSAAQNGCFECVDPVTCEVPPPGCYSDDECPDGTVCNASDICLSPPGCEDGQACPDVCYGWCEPDDGCGDGESWDDKVDACCPDTIYMPSCAMCPNGLFPEIVEVFDEAGCLEGYTCSCDTATSCDDDQPVECDMLMPLECPDGLIVAAQDGCYNCVDPETCKVPEPIECIISGCSGQVCAPEPVTTTCEWTEAYACYAYSECGNYGPNGSCGWAQTDLYLECLADAAGEECTDDESWDPELSACCPDAIYVADCLCPDGMAQLEVGEYDENGCLLGYGCACGGPCDDDSAAVCMMVPPECEEGTILAVQNGCFHCVDPDTCEPPGVEPACVVSGCSGEICAPESMSSVCMWKPEYECLQYTTCGLATDGACGWDMNDAYLDCLANVGGGDCVDGESWDAELGACCPDAIYIADCWCEDGTWPKETEDYDENGCLLGYGCECVSAGCEWDDMMLAPGAVVEAPDGCNSCTCMDSGEMACTQVPCLTECEDETGQYAVGDSWDAPDGCNTCLCMDGGEIACTKMLCPDGCDYEGEWYAVGEGFPASDGCNTCSCTASGQVACTLMACVTLCEDETGSYLPGESWDAADGCNVCTCMDSGEAACTKMLCPSGCEYEGEWYPSGVSFPANDDCNECWCTDDGSVACTLMWCPDVTCETEMGSYLPGESWTAADGCNTCMCDVDGGVACTEMVCECSPDDEWWREYVAESPEQCMVINFFCAENTEYFANDCGCGCEQSPNCPEWLNCMPPAEGCSDEELEEFQALCPLSDIAW